MSRHDDDLMVYGVSMRMVYRGLPWWRRWWIRLKHWWRGDRRIR